MYELVGYLALFVAVGFVFVCFHLVLGRLVRPTKPSPEKLTIYECGEPTIGSAWIQFDLRFYVVALLFVIFDVEVAFFFPWAIVFGKAATLSNPDLDQIRPGARKQLTEELVPNYARASATSQPAKQEISAAAASKIAWVAFFDILVFFGVLLVGFAYLWKRGDLDWVRSIAAERATVPKEAEPVAKKPALVAAGDDTW
jgi:NADH-quinone oxidoreductase subunit A